MPEQAHLEHSGWVWLQITLVIANRIFRTLRAYPAEPPAIWIRRSLDSVWAWKKKTGNGQGLGIGNERRSECMIEKKK